MNLLTLHGASEQEGSLIAELKSKIAAHHLYNCRQVEYYETSFRAEYLGLTIPEHMAKLDLNIGYARTVVNVQESRLDFEGWADVKSNNPFGLREVYVANDLASDQHLVHLDALVHGVAFVVVGTGEAGEASTLITPESPQNMTAKYSKRTRRLSSAMSINDDEITLYLPDQTIYLVETDGKLTVVSRDEHNYGRVPVVMFANNPRSNRPFGQSEITRSLRSNCDQAQRTLLNMATNSELYATAQLWITNGSPDMFDEGTTQLDLMVDRIQTLLGGNKDNKPELHQIAQQSPEPYLKIMENIGKRIAAEHSVPLRYLDATGNAPTSADALRADESALIKVAERKQSTFGRGWMEVGRLILLNEQGSIPEDFDSTVNVQWRSAATPTRAAAADEAVKLIGGGVFPPGSRVAEDRLDLSEHDKDRNAEDWNRFYASGSRANLTFGQATTPESDQDAETFVPRDE